MPHHRRASRALRLAIACSVAAAAPWPGPRGPLAFAQAPAAATATATAAKPLTQGELEALLAPIALYPDDLLMQVLMAATYPLELVQAERWLKQGNNAALKGDALAKALEAQPWDPAVKSLVPFPPVLALLNEQLDWTQRLGDAVLAQQTDVMNAVQSLRGRAAAAGKLGNTPQQVVTKTSYAAAPPPAGGVAQQVYPPSVPPPPQVYSIAPANPQVVYVPVYNPSVVYGAWPYPAYPPAYYPPPPAWGVGNALLTGMAFATGAAVVNSLWGWGSPVWGGGYANINVNRYNQINVNRTQITNATWRHDAAHRQGVAYRNPEVNSRFRGNEAGQRAAARDEFRGRAQQVQQGGGLQNALGERGGQGRPAGAEGRPNAGAAQDRVANRPNAGAAQDRVANRPNAGAAQDRVANRPNAGAAQDKLANRPNAGAAREKVANRPQQAQRPAQRPAQLPAGFQGIGNGGGDRAAAARAQTSRQLPQMGGGGFQGGGGGGGFAANRGGFQGGGGGGFAANRGGGFQGGGLAARGGGGRAGGGGRFR